MYISLTNLSCVGLLDGGVVDGESDGLFDGLLVVGELVIGASVIITDGVLVSTSCALTMMHVLDVEVILYLIVAINTTYDRSFSKYDIVDLHEEYPHSTKGLLLSHRGSHPSFFIAMCTKYV